VREPSVLPQAPVSSRFGHALRSAWALDPAVIYLNHGTVGAPPRRVLEAQQRIRDEIERQPSRFLLRELSDTAIGIGRDAKPRMRVAAETVASFFGARGDDLVFVENATSGANAVLRSLPLRAGDEILLSDHAYGGVARAAAYAARSQGASLRTVELPFPGGAPADFIAAFERGIGPKTRLALVDHITSESALVLPLREIAAMFRARGIPVLVDGAHAPGAIGFDLPALGCDWYAGNLHKWALTPRSCGILWAPHERQSGIHPNVVSWGLDKGFTSEFDWVGTRDPSAYLAAPEALAFIRELGADAMRAYNHGLACEGARHLAARWGTEWSTPEGMIGTMATVPLPERAGTTAEDAARLRDSLLEEDRIEIQLHAWKGRLWVRISAQVYNESSDVERLAEAVAARM